MLVGGAGPDTDVLGVDALPVARPPTAPHPTAPPPTAPWERPGAGHDGDRLERARAHEAAADVLAARGDWHRAYRHLKASVDLARTPRTRAGTPAEQLRQEVDRLRREHAEACEQSRRDALTAGYNRRYLDERLATLRHDGLRSGFLALADVDHFKHVNDSHGHGVGDEVLRRVAALMSTDLPADAFCARYGGEEFALVIPDLGTDAAVAVCEAARARIDRQGWDDVATGLRVTVSVGVTGLGPSGAQDVTSIAASFDAADALLYVAKRAGRNAVAYQDPSRGEVRLAGPASGRRGLPAAVRSVFACG